MQLVNLLLLFHIGLSSSNSTIKITDVMITAARIAFGIYAREGIRKPKANRTKMPIEKKMTIKLFYPQIGVSGPYSTCVNVGKWRFDSTGILNGTPSK